MSAEHGSFQTEDVETLSPQEWWNMCNEISNRNFGFGADEFVRRFRNGEYDAIVDGPEHGKVVDLVILLPSECFKPQPFDLEEDWMHL